MFESFASRSTLYLVLEYLPRGTLFNLMRKQGQRTVNNEPYLAEATARKLFMPIVQVC
jgi:serine/threonine protein kinase